jgi:N-acyl-L-homoserine lactone synthetase
MLYGFSEISGSPLYPKYLQFRHRVFNEMLGYHQTGNPVYAFEAFPSQKMAASWAGSVEYDAYDVPKMLHFAYLSQQFPVNNASAYPFIGGNVTGCLRIIPTDGPYMIRDAIEHGLWKNVRLLDDLPSSGDVYEGSRIAISPDFDHTHPEHDRILDSLVYASVELGVRLGVKRMVGIMYDGIWNKVYRKRGVPVRSK